MAKSGALPLHAAPSVWGEPDQQENRLHQIAPYIGKLKPVIARALIKDFTKAGDVVLDCFSGSGTIPLEAALLRRQVIACDTNPYALTLTRAKLESPPSLDTALSRLNERYERSQERPAYPDDAVPGWVAKFFHPATLQDALRFADECIKEDDSFLLACLLGILHHQRPGFLSYPSSHLVPYLRDRKYPPEKFPEMYERRDVLPRMVSKVTRVLKHPLPDESRRVLGLSQSDIREFTLDREVDAIVTSPPYMNALDYVRDNRLRMWFVDRTTADYSPEPTEKREQFDDLITSFVSNALTRLRVGGRCILIVGETVVRKRATSHPAERILAHILSSDIEVDIEGVIEDEIPDVRRSRRKASATKRELILVLRRTASPHVSRGAS